MPLIGDHWATAVGPPLIGLSLLWPPGLPSRKAFDTDRHGQALMRARHVSPAPTSVGTGKHLARVHQGSSMITERHSDDTTTHVQIVEAGRVVAEADLTHSDADTVEASLWAQSGAVPAGARADLVDAVLDEARHQPCTRLVAAVPTGDVESLVRLQERCEVVGTRSVGATVMVEVATPRD